MRLKYYKRLAAILILLITGSVFTLYIKQHPTLLRELTTINPNIIPILLGLYCLIIVSLIFVLQASLELCNIKMQAVESLLLTIYSATINFFGPLQSGPGFRAIYLKRQHKINLKIYAQVSLIYYGFFIIYSGLFLVISVINWQLIIVFGILFSLATAVAIKFNADIAYNLKSKKLKALTKLGLATFLQVTITALIYYLELRTFSHGIKFRQAIIYTGAANFALFVSLTPGAIGFREAFLFFSQHLHHIASPTIISASLLDRAIYVVFLGLLFILAALLHAKARLGIRRSQSTTEDYS